MKLKNWLIGLIFVQQVQLILSGESLPFSLHKKGNEKSHTGILLVSLDGKKGAICGENTGSSHITETAHIVCRHVNNLGNNYFHKAEWVDRAGRMFDWAKDWPILIKDLVCGRMKNGDTCYYNKTTSCSSSPLPSNNIFNATTISCDCYEGYYRTDEGCFKCGVDTYSLNNNTSCTPCPDGTSTQDLDDATGPEQCVLTCKSDQVKISSSCIGNSTVASICGVFVVVIAAIIALWYACKKYRAMVQQKIQKRAPKARVNCHQRHSKDWASDSDPSSSVLTGRANILVIESEVSGSQETKPVLKSRPTKTSEGNEKMRVIHIPYIVDEGREIAQEQPSHQLRQNGSTDARHSRQEMYLQAPCPPQEPTPLQAPAPGSPQESPPLQESAPGPPKDSSLLHESAPYPLQELSPLQEPAPCHQSSALTMHHPQNTEGTTDSD